MKKSKPQPATPGKEEFGNALFVIPRAEIPKAKRAPVSVKWDDGLTFVRHVSPEGREWTEVKAILPDGRQARRGDNGTMTMLTPTGHQMIGEILRIRRQVETLYSEGQNPTHEWLSQESPRLFVSLGPEYRDRVIEPDWDNDLTPAGKRKRESAVARDIAEQATEKAGEGYLDRKSISRAFRCPIKRSK